MFTFAIWFRNCCGFMEFSLISNIRAALWADHRCNAELLENTTRLRTFIPDIGTYPPSGPCREQRGSVLTASTPVSDISAFVYTRGSHPFSDHVPLQHFDR